MSSSHEEVTDGVYTPDPPSVPIKIMPKLVKKRYKCVTNRDAMGSGGSFFGRKGRDGGCAFRTKAADEPPHARLSTWPPWSAARRNAVLRDFYQHQLSKGKAPKVALTTLMRKLVVHLNSQLKIHTPQLSPC